MILTEEFTERKIMIPVWNDYLDKEEKEEAIQKIYKEPIPLENEFDFEVGRVYHQPKFQNLQLISRDKNRIEKAILLKIADSFGVENTQIRERKSLEKGNFHYTLSYGAKSFDWEKNSQVCPTIECDLKYKKVFCYGVTLHKNNQIIHTNPIQ